MKCQRCKEREANVQIMQQIAGKKPQTFMLCDVCARELGISMPSFPMTGKVSSNPFTLLGNIFQSNFGLGADEIKEQPSYRCSQCNTTFEEFKKSGFLGCPSCYEAFASQMDPVFSRTQMGKKHVGRKPGVKSSKGLENGKSPEEVYDIDLTDETSANITKESKGTAKPNGEAALSSEKPARKRKLSAGKSSQIRSDEESEELIALEKQHLDRLVEKKKEELSAAIAAEDYIKAAKLRDEIAEITKKKEG